MYEFVQKSVKKKKPVWDFNPGLIWLAIVAVSAAHHPPPPLVAILFIYRTIRPPSEKVDYTVSFEWDLVKPLHTKLDKLAIAV